MSMAFLSVEPTCDNQTDLPFAYPHASDADSTTEKQSQSQSQSQKPQLCLWNMAKNPKKKKRCLSHF